MAPVFLLATVFCLCVVCSISARNTRDTLACGSSHSPGAAVAETTSRNLALVGHAPTPAAAGSLRHHGLVAAGNDGPSGATLRPDTPGARLPGTAHGCRQSTSS